MAVNAPTVEQERVLEATGPLVAVAAAAGSGKTTLLVERIWRDLEVEQLPLDSLFVATYNRAAAEHLTARVQERFADPAAGRPNHRASLDLSAGWFGTFHSLCARVVREHPFAAGVDPAFGEIDQAEAAVLMEAAIDAALAQTEHPGLLELLSQAGSSQGVRNALVDVHERLRAAGMAEPRVTLPEPRAASSSTDELRGLLVEISAHPDVKDRHEVGLRQAALMLDSETSTRECPRISLTATNALKPLVTRANRRLEALWTSFVEAEARPQLEGFAELLERFGAVYAAAKAARGALDFEDLQLAAVRVLENARPYRFTRVYVDEFQDANALQSRILDALGAERTTVVGDGSQAIYGFRHATAEHFADRVAAAPGYVLRRNHRSQPALMRALNGLLANVMAGQPSFMELEPAAIERPDPEMAKSPLELVTVSSADGGKATRVQEAAAVRAEVENALAAGYRPGQIAVLFRAMTQVEPYRAALDAAGIPVHLVAGRGFFTHEQVADVLAMLALVANPHDEVALIRVLASPYFAASDEDLVRLRRLAGAGGALWPRVAGLDAMSALPEAVDELRALLRQQGLAALVDAAIVVCDYDLAILGLADGARRFANLQRLVRHADSFAAVRGPDLRGFLASMETLSADARLDPGEAVLTDPDLDAVRLATIHAVKGQEFPVVILADASHGRPGGGPQVAVASDGRAGLRAQRSVGSNRDVLGYTEIRAAQKADESAEERRVLYVALTRAERYIAVVGRAEGNGGGPDTAYSLVKSALGGLDEAELLLGDGRARARRWVAAAVVVPDRRPAPEVPAGRVAPSPPLPSAPEVDPEAGRQLSFSALSTFTTCPRRFRLEEELRLPGSAVALPHAAVGQTGGTEVGTLVHEYLAVHGWDTRTPEAGWASRIAQDARMTLPAATLSRAESLVAALVASTLGERIAAGSARSERPFALSVDGVLLAGAIDLEVQEPDGGLLIVDWKTHALGGRSPRDEMLSYGLQRTIYGLAALSEGVEQVELAWVFLEALDDPQVRVVTPADLPALVDEVRVSLHPLRQHQRPPASLTPQFFCDRCPGLDVFCPAGQVLL